MEISSVNSSEIKPKTDKDKKCAPGLRFEDGACMTLNLLVTMAEAYNNKFPKNKISLCSKLETLNPKKYKRYLVREFSRRLENVCDSHKCWVKQNFVKEMQNEAKHILSNYTFRPDGPKGRFTWLNTNNVNQVMHQYEKVYPEFKFFGAVPIDFDELDLEISKMNIEDLYNSGKKKMGVVYNLDEHYKPGSHWVASYCDLENGCVYFFDSYGTLPEKRIRKFLRKVERFLSEKGVKKQDVRFNKKRHQYKNSECGVYSLHFIIRLLEGEGFDDINKERITDTEVNRYRDIYFT